MCSKQAILSMAVAVSVLVLALGVSNSQQQQAQSAGDYLRGYFENAPSAGAVMLKTHRLVTRAGAGGKQHYCGEVLINALALICRGNYRKRGDEEFVPGYSGEFSAMESANSYGAYPEFLDILKSANKDQGSVVAELNKAANGGAQVAKYRPKRGVVDECCKKPCSTYTLQQYCGV